MYKFFFFQLGFILILVCLFFGFANEIRMFLMYPNDSSVNPKQEIVNNKILVPAR